MNAIQYLLNKNLFVFLLCISGVGNLWAQNETEEVDTLSATAIPSAADSLLVEQLSALGIPLYSITTHNRIEPPYTTVVAPPGCCGLTVVDNEYQPARLVIIQNSARCTTLAIMLPILLAFVSKSGAIPVPLVFREVPRIN